MIELRFIEKSFGKRKIFDSLEYTFQNGEFYVIEGKNGCGKSTLFSLLCLFDRDYYGQYLLDGRNMKHLDAREEGIIREEKFSLLTPANDLPPHMTLKELSMLEGFDVCPPSFSPERNVDTLSGGEKEILALNIELKFHKPYLLLDETSSQLDGRHVDDLLFLLEQRKKDQTVIFFTHDIRLRNRGRHLLMEDGKLREVSPL